MPPDHRTPAGTFPPASREDLRRESGNLLPPAAVATRVEPPPPRVKQEDPLASPVAEPAVVDLPPPGMS